MSKTTPLEPDRTYHVFNRGVNRGKLFTQKRHYFRFIENIFKYLPPICTIHAWCLIENHFHMLIQTKTKQELIQKNFIHKGSTEDEIINKNH
jgi:putative transposase